MSYIDVKEANAWADGNKLHLNDLDTELEASVAVQVIGRVSPVYETSGWTDNTNTPSLMRKIMAMLYMAMYYQRVYSEDSDISAYGLQLEARANALLDSIVAQDVVLVDGTVIDPLTTTAPSFYPTDASSAMAPTLEDPSLGPAKFTMGQIW